MDDRPSSKRASDPARAGAVALARGEWLDPRGLLTPRERAWLADRFAAALAVLGSNGEAGGGEVRVMVVDDAEMDAAHRRFSGVAGTTDVLTFDLRDDRAGPLDTDLLVCVDEAARQAAGRGHDRARELLLYAVHGTLHCLGEDDLDEAAAARMHGREDAVLAAIGVGATFAVAGAGPEARAC